MRSKLLGALRALLGRPPHLIPGGPTQVERVGVVTGGGGSMNAQARDAGLVLNKSYK